MIIQSSFNGITYQYLAPEGTPEVEVEPPDFAIR